MKRTPPSLLVHATNVTGLGASQVTNALLHALCERVAEPTLVLVPHSGLLSKFRCSSDNVEVRRVRRLLPRAVSRSIECLGPSIFFPRTARTIVLGDIPLRGRANQTVFMQQAHLISPAVNRLVSRTLTFRISRWIFRRNLREVRRVIVQTPVMRQQLEASYPALRGRIEVMIHPAPSRSPGERRTRHFSEGLSLLYPAAGYPHKNHKLIAAMQSAHSTDAAVLKELVVTLTATEMSDLRLPRWARNVGSVPADEMTKLYEQNDGLFFPSLLESFGAPLIEAMAAALPIVCADLPYARWMCGAEAIYFNPTDPEDAWRAIRELHRGVNAGWQPDWSAPLEKFAASWDSIAEQFLAQ